MKAHQKKVVATSALLVATDYRDDMIVTPKTVVLREGHTFTQGLGKQVLIRWVMPDLRC